VNIARAQKFKLEKEDKVVGAAFQGPLIVMGRRNNRRFVALGFDLRETDLPLRISWPLFLLNTINDFVDEDTSYISSFRTGEVWRIPVPSETRDALLTAPDGSTRNVPVLQGNAVFLGTSAGFYSLKSGPAGAVTETAFAVNLSDIEESTIAPADTLSVEGQAAGQVEGFHVGVRREIWIYLLIAAIAVSTIEWVTYHRRITV
jgi:hypothetical protein